MGGSKGKGVGMRCKEGRREDGFKEGKGVGMNCMEGR